MREVGEFELIDRISQLLGPNSAVIGIGDDAAVLDVPGSDYLLATVDMLVQGVHFHPQVETRSVGRHAIAVNVSDIAAMGGTPQFALVSLALPPDLPARFVDELYEGMREESSRFGVQIVGGNLARSEGGVVVDVSLLGRVAKESVVLRKGAEPGDLLVVTGTLGRTAADRLESQQEGRSWSWQIEPRLAVGQALAAAHIAHAMIDLSDGLAGDVRHLCRASDAGAVIYEETVPVSIGLRRLCQRFSLDPVELALTSGEDYELLIALPEERLETAHNLAADVPLAVVGTVLHADQGMVLEHVGGQRDPLPQGGWKHF